MLNGYQIVDLATYRSDGFVVKNLWATAFLTGVNIGGGSSSRLARAVRHLLRRPLREPARQLAARLRKECGRDVHRAARRRVLPRRRQRAAVARCHVVQRVPASRDVSGHAFLGGPYQLDVLRSEQRLRRAPPRSCSAPGPRSRTSVSWRDRRTPATKCRPQRHFAASPRSMTARSAGAPAIPTASCARAEHSTCSPKTCAVRPSAAEGPIAGRSRVQ